MKKGLLETIKSRGYWRVNFQPLTASTRLKTLQECKDIMEKNSVRLRGWDYPHFPRRNDEDGGTAPCGEFYEGWEDSGLHKEFWRMYKSGQFLYYRSLREDWIKEEGFTSGRIKDIKPGEKLGIVGSVIYEMTEAFEFLSRLTQAGLYDEGVNVKISLHNTQGRELWVEDEMRAEFIFPRKTGASELVFSESYTKEDIL